ncbi:hypothetical protein BT63DRAFT_474935 [Microthyrium microscopicum]|uniref:Uncharacterized protein n=1 Tax=Microthyrium microscopicum TaxID=703497 RepID=A0A6A6UT47_9PEZI|nr:hypothetical protein BT63DRAFT_474935 [Microthyrium microscopicum]
MLSLTLLLLLILSIISITGLTLLQTIVYLRKRHRQKLQAIQRHDYHDDLETPPPRNEQWAPYHDTTNPLRMNTRPTKLISQRKHLRTRITPRPSSTSSRGTRTSRISTRFPVSPTKNGRAQSLARSTTSSRSNTSLQSTTSSTHSDRLSSFPAPSLFNALDVPTSIDTTDNYLSNIHLGRDTSLSASFPATWLPSQMLNSDDVLQSFRSDVGPTASLERWMKRLTTHVHRRACGRYNVVAVRKEAGVEVLVEGVIADFEVRYYGPMGVEATGDGGESSGRNVFRVIVFREGMVNLPVGSKEDGGNEDMEVCWDWKGRGKEVDEGILEFEACV